ncbi:hypothetical protein [Azospirillum argentinense]
MVGMGHEMPRGSGGMQAPPAAPGGVKRKKCPLRYFSL